jgi:predicted kinase
MATLHFVAGKAGAGKTTLARTLARDSRAVLICEDEWMLRLEGVFFGIIADAQVDEVNRFFTPPEIGEGFTVVLY